MERVTSNYRENVTLLAEEKNRNLVMFCKTFFDKYLLEHFIFEETILFPVIKLKSLESEQVVKSLILDHKYIMQTFSECKHIEEYDMLISILNGLMNRLSIHAKKEDGLLSSLNLTKEELTKIEHKSVVVK